MLYHIYAKSQMDDSSVVVTLIANILCSVSVCMTVPLRRQDYCENKFSNGSTIIFSFQNLNLV